MARGTLLQYTNVAERTEREVAAVDQTRKTKKPRGPKQTRYVAYTVYGWLSGDNFVDVDLTNKLCKQILVAGAGPLRSPLISYSEAVTKNYFRKFFKKLNFAVINSFI